MTSVRRLGYQGNGNPTREPLPLSWLLLESNVENMRRWISIASLLLCLCLLLQCIAIAQQVEGQRKIVTKVIPHYPELARPMRLEGTVKLMVSVAPNGNVKSMQAVGGNPLLLQAAQSAIQGWKWEPARQESQESVELRFRPN